jgi:shikimate kinase
VRAAGKPFRLDKAALLPLSSRTNGTRIGTGINAKGSELEAGQANANVFFVGLMGAGKTTVGRAVARRLQRSFIDSDHEIEARTGARIPVIWEVEGEEGFRQREADVIDELSRRENREHLKSRGLVIYLRATPHELWQRTRRDKTRPLLQTDDPRGKLEALYKTRDPLYQECAHFIVETGRPTVNNLVNMVLMQLEMAGIAKPATS